MQMQKLNHESEIKKIILTLNFEADVNYLLQK